MADYPSEVNIRSRSAPTCDNAPHPINTSAINPQPPSLPFSRSPPFDASKIPLSSFQTHPMKPHGQAYPTVQKYIGGGARNEACCSLANDLGQAQPGLIAPCSGTHVHVPITSGSLINRNYAPDTSRDAWALVFRMLVALVGWPGKSWSVLVFEC